MKKILVSITMIGLMFGSAMAKEVLLKQDILNKIQNINIIKKAGFKIIKGKIVGDLYAVKATNPRSPNLTLFVTKNLKTVIIGAGFNAKGERIEFLTNMNKYKNKALWTVGNGKKDYYVFTDPECPFCQTFEKNLKNLKPNAKLHVFLFPLSFHRHAISMSKYILSLKGSAARAKAIEDIAKGDTTYQKAKYTDEESIKLKKMIDDSVNLGRKLNVNGTPTVFDKNGKNIGWPTLLTKAPVR